MPMTPQTAQIIFLQKGKVQKALKIFSYPDEEMVTQIFSSQKTARIKWSIFGVVAADNYITNLILKTIRRCSEENGGEFNLLSSDAILEKILQKLNVKILEDSYLKTLAEKSSRRMARPSLRSENQKIKTPPNDIDTAFVVIKDDGISFGGCGDIAPMFIRSHLLSRKYAKGNQINLEITNLLENAGGAFDFKTGFQNIITGEVMPGDIFIVSTKNLWDCVYNENLLDGLLRLPPKSAVEFLRNKIGIDDETPPQNHLWGGCLIISWRNKDMYTYDAKMADRSQTSIFQLINLTKETEKILSSSLSNISIKNTFKSFIDKERTAAQAKEKNENKNFVHSWQKKYRFIFNILVGFFLFSFAALKTLAILTMVLGKNLFFVITNRQQKRKQILNDAVYCVEQIFFKIIFKFNALPHAGKTCLILAMGLAVMFSQSVFVVNAQMAQKLQKERSKQTIETIRKNLSDAEANMIYKNNAAAHDLISASLALFETLPRKSRAEKTLREELAREIDKIRFAYQHAEVVQDPMLVTTFENFKGKQLFAAGNELLASTDKNGLFFIEPREQKTNFITTIASPDDYMILIGAWSNGILFIKNDQLLNLNTRTKTANPIFWTAPEISLKNSLFYINQNNLYILNSAENKFFKILSGSNGFIKTTNYLRDNVGVQNVLALTGDAAIYLFNKNGALEKFAYGRKELVDWTPLDPIYSDSAASRPKIWTSAETLFIYILDPSGKRLVVYNKNGNLKKQYFSPQFNELIDFVVDEKNKQIFLLNGNKIFGIVAEHLNEKE